MQSKTKLTMNSKPKFGYFILEISIQYSTLFVINKFYYLLFLKNVMWNLFDAKIPIFSILIPVDI